MRSLTLVAFAVAVMSPVAQAQVTVQQPVVRTTGVATSVSVPDRGSVLLGGVRSAESFRQSYGPLRTGTSRGYGLSSGSLSASVTIIDLHAMDEAILNSVPDPSPALAIRGRRPEPDRPVVQATLSPVEKAANFERMARNAESAGKPGVARLHWQMAARYGSSIARDKLRSPALATAGK